MKLLREPLVHFLLLGALIFALFAIFGRNGATGGGPAKSVVVSEGNIAVIRRNFEVDNGRGPTDAELSRAIDAYVHEEILVREARAENLDTDDSIVRRRLVQKMEFAAEPAPPTEAQLAEFFAAHKEDYRNGQVIRFRQMFIDRDKRGAAASDDARALVELLNKHMAVPPGAADATTLPAEMNATRGEIAKVFGELFAREVLRAPISSDHWSGPVDSAAGLHAVLVTGRTEGQIPALGDVRSDVTRDYLTAHRKEALDAMYQQYRTQYDVVIERSGATTAAAAATKGGQP